MLLIRFLSRRAAAMMLDAFRRERISILMEGHTLPPPALLPPCLAPAHYAHAP